MADAAQDILFPVDADNSVKAAAWQAFRDSTEENDFPKQIGGMNLPQETKAALWEAKKSGATNRGPSQSAGLTLPSNMSIGATPAPTGIRERAERWAQNVMDADKPPVTWDEARRFYSNVSRLSANEYQNMAPQMASAVSKFAGAFDDSLRAAAEAAGKGDEYAEAMNLYSKAKGWQKFGSDTWNTLKGMGKAAVAGAAGGVAGSKAVGQIVDALVK